MDQDYTGKLLSPTSLRLQRCQVTVSSPSISTRFIQVGQQTTRITAQR